MQVEENLEQLELVLDSRCSGWRDHIISIRKTKNVSIGVRNEHRVSADLYAQNNIFLAGDWIENEHILSDAALESGGNLQDCFLKQNDTMDSMKGYQISNIHACSHLECERT